MGSRSKGDPSPYPFPQQQNAWVEVERKNSYALLRSAVSLLSESEDRPGKIHSGAEMRRKEIHLRSPGSHQSSAVLTASPGPDALRTPISCLCWHPQQPCVGVSLGPWPGISQTLVPGRNPGAPPTGPKTPLPRPPAARAQAAGPQGRFTFRIGVHSFVVIPGSSTRLASCHHHPVQLIIIAYL